MLSFFNWHYIPSLNFLPYTFKQLHFFTSTIQQKYLWQYMPDAISPLLCLLYVINFVAYLLFQLSLFPFS
jgi:hypothetical protein